ncbi:nuclear transport factor 2 family protein (plasmid) [Streptomyces sp. NBC_00053]|uniref:nuclear transport factor 2 family protein n=1 Tax=unclassified Streptomyces TaxID=2593676 RepID=UPI000F5BDB64|nr:MULTISPECIES: nuclear transport factor 2 family protein [unclassified Streptomyces]WSG56267.1 nuclear transport factor 2 family protein [Streptomyces sp. NBC_01732]WSX07434.1 nuclear transport factor 2 family protein [Streptomyces sp. NBC_00987]MCX4399712.1 nuclear transport factor 2 family protein [Streptomyces sp. NBC_01767]MCX5106497.1 nuclear transport factor 2 family protein [Streptomyces sp. NBC_00439]MCX5165679.1 nuclear transport factor 2 family protein [Streptomyces sp. NBC_00305]
MSRETEDVREAIAGELRLMDPSVRMSRSLAGQLMDPDFVEVGASGRRWTYDEMLAALPELDGAAEGSPRYEPSNFTGVLLAPGLVHLTYETTLDGERARRSSLWRKQGAAATWQMYYHQATPIPPDSV